MSMAQDHPVLWGYLWQFVFACGFIVLIAAWLFIKRFPEILAAVRAAGWPVAQGRVETVAVKTLSGQALGELAYSYLAEGERYSGYLTRPFADEQDAWEFVDQLKGQSLLVRYKPGAPSISAIRIVEQNPQVSAPSRNFVWRLFSVSLKQLFGA